MLIDSYLDEEKFIRFTRFDLIRRRKQWRSPAVFSSILCLSALICFIMHRIDGAVLLGCVLMLTGLGVPFMYFITFSRSLKKQAKELNLTPARLVYSLELTADEEGIRIFNEKEKACYKWKSAHMAYLDKGCIYLYITPERAFLIPYENDDYIPVWQQITSMISERCTDIR